MSLFLTVKYLPGAIGKCGALTGEDEDHSEKRPHPQVGRFPQDAASAYFHAFFPIIIQPHSAVI